MRLNEFSIEVGTATVGVLCTTTVTLSTNYLLKPTVTLSPIGSSGNVTVYVDSVTKTGGLWLVTINSSAPNVSVNYQVTGLT